MCIQKIDNTSKLIQLISNENLKWLTTNMSFSSQFFILIKIQLHYFHFPFLLSVSSMSFPPLPYYNHFWISLKGITYFLWLFLLPVYVNTHTHIHTTHWVHLIPNREKELGSGKVDYFLECESGGLFLFFWE